MRQLIWTKLSKFATWLSNLCWKKIMEKLNKFINFGKEVLRTAHVITKWTVCKILFIKQCKCKCKNNDQKN